MKTHYLYIVCLKEGQKIMQFQINNSHFQSPPQLNWLKKSEKARIWARKEQIEHTNSNEGGRNWMKSRGRKESNLL